ncbi:MAG: hypothetical protein KGL39_58790, partial [Patescibacteria group bacterium]|nr:hypothetical protein [Patescibacteria group bacterium]
SRLDTGDDRVHALLVRRFLYEAPMILTSRATVAARRLATDRLLLLDLSLEKYLPWDPGMFLQLSLQTYDPSKPWPASKPFSIASWGLPRAKLLVRREGTFTTRLFEVAEKGACLTARYPYGHLDLTRPGRKVFLAGGAGVSAFMGYLDYKAQIQDASPVSIFHSVPLEAEALPNLYPGPFPGDVRIDVHVTREATSRFHRGRGSPEAVVEHLDLSPPCQVFISGPPGFVRDFADASALRRLGPVAVEEWTSTPLSV